MKKVKPTYTTVPWKSLDDPDKFRNADRIEEAQKIPLTESQQKQAELEPIKEVDWKELYEKEHKLRQEAEGETTIVKGIGQNSPEMKAAKRKIEELKADLARAREDHQFDNMIHQKELDKTKK